MARLVFGIVAALLLMSARLVAGQESIAAARDLYASAAYEDALAMLNRLPDSNRPLEEVHSIEQYRAFCLLALGRTAEAEHAIEVIVSAEPTYRPANDLSPRVRNAFTEVRRRVLPSLIQQKYMQAKGAFDRKEFGAAASGFSYVLDAMNDPDVAPQAGQPPLSDIRTLAIGFKDLAVSAAAPPPPPAAPMTAAPVEPPPTPKPPRIYTSNDQDVTAPAVVRQELPPFPGQVVIPRQGMIEIVIDETGAVESVMMRISVSPAYDQLALNTAKMWRYRPATLNGIPVKYRKAVQITIKPIGPPR